MQFYTLSGSLASFGIHTPAQRTDMRATDTAIMGQFNHVVALSYSGPLCPYLSACCTVNGSPSLATFQLLINSYVCLTGSPSFLFTFRYDAKSMRISRRINAD